MVLIQKNISFQCVTNEKSGSTMYETESTT